MRKEELYVGMLVRCPDSRTGTLVLVRDDRCVVRMVSGQQHVYSPSELRAVK